MYPALAIAEALRESRGDIEIVFLGTASGLESKIVPSFGESFRVIQAGGLVGKSIADRAKGAVNAAIGVAQSLKLLRKIKPAVVVGTGGFVMAPVLLAARLLRLPFVIQEQNSYPGLTTRRFAGWAKQVCIAYPQAAQHLTNASTILTGNPLRKQLVEFASTSRTNSQGNPPRILITGGSLGARSINNAVAESLAELCSLANVTWQFGRSGAPDALSSTMQVLTDTGKLQAAAFFDDMPRRYADSDMVVCRAGAMTLSEVSLFGLPSLLIPFPHAAHDHQTSNAKSFQEAGAASLIQDKELDGEALLTGCKTILTDRKKYDSMSAAMNSLARPTAAKQIAEIVFSSIDS